MAECLLCFDVVQAAHNGHMICLDKYQSEWTPFVVEEAIHHNQMAVVEELINAGCPVDTTTVLAAVHSNHLPAVQWSVEAGAPLSETVWMFASTAEIQDYLTSVNCPKPPADPVPP